MATDGIDSAENLELDGSFPLGAVMRLGTHDFPQRRSRPFRADTLSGLILGLEIIMGIVDFLSETFVKSRHSHH